MQTLDDKVRYTLGDLMIKLLGLEVTIENQHQQIIEVTKKLEALEPKVEDKQGVEE